jgi:hypothetical protein
MNDTFPPANYRPAGKASANLLPVSTWRRDYMTGLVDAPHEQGLEVELSTLPRMNGAVELPILSPTCHPSGRAGVVI